MKTLFEPVNLKHLTLKNRVCVPPMVCFNWAGEDGVVSEKHIAHYAAIAAGGPGLLIQEATCISPEGKLGASQLGIWSDGHIAGHTRIAEAVHAAGVPILMQIHHAGVVGIDAHPLCPSAYTLDTGKTGTEMTEADIARLVDAYAQAARRAFDAGYDGVELHGCHSYLISQFLSSRVNTREDGYGRDRLRFVREILAAVRAVTPESFIVGIRLGAFEPTLADGLAHAKALEAMGMDFLNISYGFSRDHAPSAPPAGFPFKDIVWAAGEIAKAVHVPVFAVNGLRTPEQAQQALELTDVDMVCIARSILADYNWPRRAEAGQPTGRCLDCEQCQWFRDFERCPGRVKTLAGM